MDEFYQLFGISAEELLHIHSSDDSSLEFHKEDEVEMDADGNFIWSKTTSHLENTSLLEGCLQWFDHARDCSYLCYFSLIITEEIF